MNKNINNAVELTEKELEGVCGGVTWKERDEMIVLLVSKGVSAVSIREWLNKHPFTDC